MKHSASFLTLLLVLAAALYPCLYENFYAGEAEWVFIEPWLVECLSSYFTRDRVAMNVLERELRAAYPHVTWKFNILPIVVDKTEIKNKARAPITLVKNSGEGFSVTVARFEKKVPAAKDFAPIVLSKTKTKISRLLRKKDLVLLVLKGKNEAGNKAMMKCARKALKMTQDMVGIKCHILSTGLNFKSERALVKNILWGKKGKRPGILMIFGKGKVLYFLDDPKKPNLIMEMAHKLDLETNTEAHDLKPRLLINMPTPKYVIDAGIKEKQNPKYRNKTPGQPRQIQEDPNRSLQHLLRQ
jgi:hypothetical protein